MSFCVPPAHLQRPRIGSGPTLLLAVLLGLVGAVDAHAGGTRIWIWFDDDGTPVFSDRQAHPQAEPYRLGTFEEVALRQQNTPHRGYEGPGLTRGSAVAAPNVPPAIRHLAHAAARKYGVDESLVLAVIGIESAYRIDAVSRVGARGLMQLMPATAEDLGVDASIPEENVDGGTRYLAWLLTYFKSERLALAGYNAGPGRVKRAGNVVPNIPETKYYVSAVLALRDALQR